MCQLLFPSGLALSQPLVSRSPEDMFRIAHNIHNTAPYMAELGINFQNTKLYAFQNRASVREIIKVPLLYGVILFSSFELSIRDLLTLTTSPDIYNTPVEIEQFNPDLTPKAPLEVCNAVQCALYRLTRSQHDHETWLKNSPTTDVVEDEWSREEQCCRNIVNGLYFHQVFNQTHICDLRANNLLSHTICQKFPMASEVLGDWGESLHSLRVCLITISGRFPPNVTAELWVLIFGFVSKGITKEKLMRILEQMNHPIWKSVVYHNGNNSSQGVLVDLSNEQENSFPDILVDLSKD